VLNASYAAMRVTNKEELHSGLLKRLKGIYARIAKLMRKFTAARLMSLFPQKTVNPHGHGIFERGNLHFVYITVFPFFYLID